MGTVSSHRKTKLRVIWAVDPFSDNKELLKSASLLLKDIAQGRLLSVRPVYLLHDDPLKSNQSEAQPDMNKVRTLGQKVIDGVIETTLAPSLENLKVRYRSKASLKESVDEIVSCAQKWNADLILIASHGRQGIKRWRMGSFAETLLLHSDIPVFILNLLWDHENNFKHILFSTDFSKESKLAFLKLLPFAKFLGSEITIFHKMNYNHVEIPYSAMSHSEFDIEVETEVRAANQEGQKWIKEAKAHGVQACFVLDHSISNAVAKEVLSESDKKPGLIALASESAEFFYSVFGTVTTGVLRNAHHPVWVFRPKAKKQKRQPHQTKSTATVDRNL